MGEAHERAPHVRRSAAKVKRGGAAVHDFVGRRYFTA